MSVSTVTVGYLGGGVLTGGVITKCQCFNIYLAGTDEHPKHILSMALDLAVTWLQVDGHCCE